MTVYNVGDILTANEFEELNEVITSVKKTTTAEEAVGQIDVSLDLIAVKVKDLQYFKFRISEYAELKEKLKEVVKGLPVTDDVVDLSGSFKKNLH